jgi:pimeloyl-ACP methyl ester carboxylesterase
MPFLNGSDVALYYEVAGEGPAVCLINGYRLSGMVWPQEFLERLSERFTVIHFDNRGTGRSDKPPAGYDFASQA